MDKNKTLADRLGLPQSVVETAASMDPVNKKALKGKHKDRKDKDIDNDGDVDASDKYLHKRRKAISKAVDETKGAPKGYHFTRDGKLKKGDADADGPGGKKLRSDPLDKQRSKIPPLPEEVEEGAFSRMDTQRQEKERLGAKKVKGTGLKTFVPKPKEKKLGEARRGRPPKSGVHSTDDMEAGKHIIVQLRKAVSMRGNHHVEFKDGKKHKISMGHANKALNTHRSLRTPAEKKAFQDKLHKSHDSFHAALKDKNPGKGPQKRGITLPGSKRIGGSF